MSTATTFDPLAFRFTVRAPESRYAAIRKAAANAGMEPGQLVQALFDRLDLTKFEGEIAQAVRHHGRLHATNETTKELAQRAQSVGLTPRELKVFRALAATAGAVGIVRPNAMDITVRSGVTESFHETVYDALMAKGFIALAPSQGRGRRAYQILRAGNL